jgi:hypothetical protein
VFTASILIDASDLAGARRALDEASTDVRPEGVAWRLAVTARLALAERHAEKAARDARDAFDRLAHLGHAVGALDPATTLVRASLARGDLAGARDALDRLAELELEGTFPRLTIALLRAEIAGDRAAFAKVRDEASAAKLAIVERDARRDLAR